MRRWIFLPLTAALIAGSGVAVGQTVVTSAGPASNGWTGLRAGVGVADGTWHVGSGAGQYASTQNPFSLQSEWDPNLQHVKKASSYGVASRLSIRAIVLQDGYGDAPIALVKTDNYLTQDMLTRRAAQILAHDGSKVTYDNLLVSATHDHNSPYYSSPAWGVWLFQDAADLRMFEYQARQIAAAVESAERSLRPARIGGTTVQFPDFQGNIAGSGVNEDGSPTGYPLWENDHGLTVLRIDDMTNTAAPKPLATYINYAEHGESLDDYDLISADWLAPFQRYVDRATGVPTVFSQGSVGSAEGPYEYANPKQESDGGDTVPEVWAHMGYAQAERGTHVMAERAVAAWQAIGGADNGVPVQAPFSANLNPKVRMLTRWYAGPLSHPYPSVGNCRTGPTASGDPGAPAAGLPDCERSDDKPGLTLPISPEYYNELKAAGAPIPDNYDAPSYSAVEENLRLKLQAVRIGDILLASCACEPQSDLIKNLETRTDTVKNNMWLGMDYGRQDEVDAAWPDAHVDACFLDTASSMYSCPNPGDRSGTGARLMVSKAAYEHMEYEINNNAAGWNAPTYVAQANSEPANPADIKGNFTHSELGTGGYRTCPGYAVSVGLGHSSDYNGYTVSYREYMARDAYRKALTSYGPHTADYMVTNLVSLAANLSCGIPVPRQATDAIALADEQRQQAEAITLGKIAAAEYKAWTAQIPDSAGPARVIKQPWNLQRFDVTQFRWVGGDDWTDNPTVNVQRLVGGVWQPYADQSGEVQVFLDRPTNIVQGAAGYRSGTQQWNWRASFEAFDSYPRADVPGGQVPSGTYRFVVNGRIHSGGAVHPYQLSSAAFTVSPWAGMSVSDVQQSGSQLSFVVNDTYPRLPTEAHRAGIRWYADDGGGTPGHSLICKTCSFRPWATAGQVTAVAVVVNGSTVAAAYDTASGRWVVSAPTGASVHIAPNGLHDAYGETNGTDLVLA